MTCVILNSGIGSRIGALTENMPKCLLELNPEETVLSRQLDIFTQNGVKNFLITTGHCHSKIVDYVTKLKSKYESINVTFVENPSYSSTNYIYSLYLARSYLKDDIILIHGDLVFEPSLVENFLSEDKEKSIVVIQPDADLPEKDFKAQIAPEGYIRGIRVDYVDDCVPLMPLYRITAQKWDIWMKAMENHILNGIVNCYAEDAFNQVSQQIQLFPFQTKDFCMEIDTMDDYLICKQRLGARQ